MDIYIYKKVDSTVHVSSDTKTHTHTRENDSHSKRCIALLIKKKKHFSKHRLSNVHCLSNSLDIATVDDDNILKTRQYNPTY